MGFRECLLWGVQSQQSQILKYIPTFSYLVRVLAGSGWVQRAAGLAVPREHHYPAQMWYSTCLQLLGGNVKPPALFVWTGLVVLVWGYFVGFFFLFFCLFAGFLSVLQWKRHISVSCMRKNEVLAISQVFFAPLWCHTLCSQHQVLEMKSFGVCSLQGNVDFSWKTLVLVTGFF